MIIVDNSAKPTLHLKLGARPAAVPSPTPPSTLPSARAPSPPRPSLPTVRVTVTPTAPPPSPKPPSEPPVTWATYKSVLETIPPPDFDTKSATAEDWARFGLLLTPRQRKAQRLKWTMGTCAIFGHGFGARGDAENQRAFRYAMSRLGMIFQAFREHKSRESVLAQLAEEWVKAEGGANE